MDCIVHAVAKSRAQLSDFHFHNPLLLDSTWRYGKRGSIREADWEKSPKMFLEDSPVSLKPRITVSVMQWWYLIGSGERFWVCFLFSGHVFSFLSVWLSSGASFSRAVKLLRLEVGSFGHKVALFFFHLWFKTLAAAAAKSLQSRPLILDKRCQSSSFNNHRNWESLFFFLFKVYFLIYYVFYWSIVAVYYYMSCRCII